MNTGMKIGLLASAMGLAMFANPAHAGWQVTTHASNSVGWCQPFEPGKAGNIRNRVIGMQNISSVSSAISCSFEGQNKFGSLSYAPDTFTMWFQKPWGLSVNKTVTCTLRQGYDTQANFVLETKEVVFVGLLQPASRKQINFNQAQNMTFYITSANCLLPPNIYAQDMYYDINTFDAT